MTDSRFQLVDYELTDPRTEVNGHTQDYWLSQFFSNGGNEQLFEFYGEINDISTVFDMGSYDGEYYSKLYNLYNCNIHTFEPVTQFAADCPKLPKVKINDFALGNKNTTFQLTLNDNSSSEFTLGKKIECIKKRFREYVQDYNINYIDLMKINIEGGEYELFDEIFNYNYQENINIFLIQFHYLLHKPIEEREIIINKLKETHDLVWAYPFVWEYWKLKE